MHAKIQNHMLTFFFSRFSLKLVFLTLQKNPKIPERSPQSPRLYWQFSGVHFRPTDLNTPCLMTIVQLLISGPKPAPTKRNASGCFGTKFNRVFEMEEGNAMAYQKEKREEGGEGKRGKRKGKSCITPHA